MPAVASTTTTGMSRRAASMPMTWKRPTASALFSSDQPPGLSISRASEELRWAVPSTRKKLVITRMRSKEASVAASREAGKKPRS